MIENHKPNEQFNFKEMSDGIKTENFSLYRDNKFTKYFINNRHDLKMSKYNNAGYGYQIFHKNMNIGSIWFLNQINSKTTYIRISRYESTRHGYFIAVLSELSDFFNDKGYSLVLKTKIKYAQNILDLNFNSVYSKKSNSKRGINDRSKNNVSVDGFTYYLDDRKESYNKWHDEISIIEA